ncbi:MAG: 6-phosphofructokinase [Polyangiales bacterium]
MKACILTGGGDAPGLDAAIRGFVHRVDQLGIEVWGSRDGFEGLLEAGQRLVRLELDAVRGILHRGGSIIGCSSTKSNPFAMPVRRGTRETRDRSGEVIARMKEHGFDALVLVGGDGTMLHARRFAERGVPCIGVPKTIDNDLSATDQTFGFDTAVGTATWAIDTLHSTAEAHERVMILEVMGRTSGWIALFSGIAGGADVILLPEIPYDIARICEKIRGRRFTIVVVAEGARPRDGELTFAEAEAKPGQLRRLGGAGESLARALESRIDSEVRVTVLGHLQRGGSPSAFDRMLGSRAGVHAAELVSARTFGRLVSLRCGRIGSVPFTEMDARPKQVDPRGELVATARGLGIELGG